uniref:Uncharacterized protein n=1 Tax=Spironucleus salmonicida TaxID=348837 RepID=V6LMX0_9EUKA|eukprot:EST42064.1 hypothetical protein SS50377_18371 [Spironucleus salmonicida]
MESQGVFLNDNNKVVDDLNIRDLDLINTLINTQVVMQQGSNSIRQDCEKSMSVVDKVASIRQDCEKSMSVVDKVASIRQDCEKSMSVVDKVASIRQDCEKSMSVVDKVASIRQDCEKSMSVVDKVASIRQDCEKSMSVVDKVASIRQDCEKSMSVVDKVASIRQDCEKSMSAVDKVASVHASIRQDCEKSMSVVDKVASVHASIRQDCEKSMSVVDKVASIRQDCEKSMSVVDKVASVHQEAEKSVQQISFFMQTAEELQSRSLQTSNLHCSVKQTEVTPQDSFQTCSIITNDISQMCAPQLPCYISQPQQTSQCAITDFQCQCDCTSIENDYENMNESFCVQVCPEQKMVFSNQLVLDIQPNLQDYLYNNAQSTSAIDFAIQTDNVIVIIPPNRAKFLASSSVCGFLGVVATGISGIAGWMMK